jgi:hypothetical protein
VLVATTLFSGKITIPQYFALTPTPLVAITVAVLFYFLASWFRSKTMSRQLHAKGAMQLWQAALVLSGVSLASYVLIGMPLGITTAYAKVGAWFEMYLFPDHYASLGFFTAQPLSYRNPFTGILLTGGPGPVLDGIAIIQFPLIMGIILGGTISALRLGEFAPHHAVPWRQYVSAMSGGVLMGLASRMTPACNVWHLLGGLPILAFASIAFLAGMLPGAWIGGRILVKWVVH